MAGLDETHPDFVAVRQATAAMFKAVKKVRRREIRDAIAEADRAVVAATATGAADRIDDETRGIPISTATTAPTAGTLHQGARLLHLQAAVHGRRRVLPPALPDVRGDEPREARRAHRPHRQARPAHRRPREDRHVHRAAAAARRRAHDDHDALPARRGAPLQQPARCARVDRPPQGRRHRPARPRPGDRARRGRRGGGSPRHPDQQRDPDGAPLAGRVPAARRCRARAAAERAAARARHVRPHERPAPAGAGALGDRPPDPRRGRRPRRRADRAGDGRRVELARAPRRRHGDRRRRADPRPPPRELVDAARRRGRPARDARGAAGEHDGAVPAGLEAAAVAWRRAARGARTS